MDDGAVVGCGITPKTMLARIAGETGNTDCKDTVEGADSDEEMLDPRG